ncbi:MAG TPA: nitrile hydratase accessory protein [Vicinamibacterales bacterium]|nr:nitrile hydratase accessory protein [Vicinamibacterales bacterium]
MNESDLAIAPDRLAELPRLPRDEGGPVFAEPWQAQAFALAVKLSEQGHYTWKEWAAALSHQLQAAEKRGEPDDGSRYYEHWLAALESLAAAKGLADRDALETRKAAWVDAYRNTPHGQPVELIHSRTRDVRWLLVGVVGTIVTYWLLHQAGIGSGAEHSIAAASSAADSDSALPLGFGASAGLGALLGMRHALEPDHLAAVSTLMTGERSSAKAAWLGAFWGMGHTLTLFATGALLVALQTEMPAMAARVFEVCVVLLLIGFGIRAIYQGARRVPAGPTHTHRRPGTLAFGVDRWTAARPFIIGAVHGLAGSGALTAIVVTTLPSTTTRLGYLLLFGFGSTAGMAVLSGLLGWPLARLGNNIWFTRTVSLVVGSISAALGLVWGIPIIVDAL